MNVRSGPKLKIASASFAALTLAGFVPGANATEAEYSGQWCGHFKSTVLESNSEVTTLVTEGWGIETPPYASPLFANATLHCAGYMRVLGGKRFQVGSCKWVDGSGDSFVGEYEERPDIPGKWTFLAGTGKWKGIKGTGTYKSVATGKPAAPGTMQICRVHSGKYTLP